MAVFNKPVRIIVQVVVDPNIRLGSSSASYVVPVGNVLGPGWASPIETWIESTIEAIVNVADVIEEELGEKPAP